MITLVSAPPQPVLVRPRSLAMPAAAVAAGLVVAALVAALLRAGFVAPTAFAWSNSILIDGGWRLYQGQVPHSDFHSPIGYGYLFLVSLAMREWGPTPHALAQAAAMAVVPIAIAAWFLAARRFPPVMAALVTAFIAVHAASVSFFGTSDDQGISFSGQYTRLAWSIFFLLPLQALADPREPLEGWPALAEHLLVGIVLGALFGIKATFFVGGVACIATGLLLRPGWDPWRAGLVMAVACVMTIAIGLAASGASLVAYLADLVMAQRSNATGLPRLLLNQLGRTDAMQACLLAAGLVVSWPALRAGRAVAGIPLDVVRALVLLALGFAISAFNGTEYASPIYGLCCLILCASGLSGSGSGAIATVALLAPLLILGTPVIKAGLHGHPDPGPSDSLDLPSYRGVDFIAGGTAGDGPLVPYLARSPHAVFSLAYLRSLREGVAHLRAHLPEDSRVLTMDVANPFPFALGWPSPKGDVLYWHLDRNVSDRTAPFPEALFAEADAVLVPAVGQMGGVTAGKLALYRPWLESHFDRVALDTPWWSELWLRPGHRARRDGPAAPDSLTASRPALRPTLLRSLP